MPRKKKTEIETLEQKANLEISEEKKTEVKKPEDDEAKLEEIKKKAKKLALKIEEEEDKEKITEQTFEELKAKVEDSSKEESTEDAEKKKKKKEKRMLSEKELKKIMTDTKETLAPLTDYIRCSVHLGTKVITPDMRRYVYKRRADGLAVINTNLIDDRLREAVEFFNQFETKDMFIACKREAGWPAVEKFAKLLGIRKFTKKYPAGIITNLRLDDFFEARLVLVCDPWVDKNALNDAIKVDMSILGICDTNNYTRGITKAIIANNKSQKSIGLILYILAREYLKSHGREKEAKELVLEDFTGKLEDIDKE